MADIQISGSTLVVDIVGADQFFALKSRLEVPLEHVAGVDVSPEDARAIWHGLRVGGTNLPGVITAGRFLQGGQWAFWDVHEPARCIAIRLHDEHYARLVIGVDDPEAAAERIRSALH